MSCLTEAAILHFDHHAFVRLCKLICGNFIHFHHCCTHQMFGLVQNEGKKIWGTYGKITGRCGRKQDRYAQSQSFNYITAHKHLCMYATHCMSFSQTQTQSWEKKMRDPSIFLTDVMNVSAWPTLLPWCITAVCLSSLFFAYYSLRESTDLPQVHFSFSVSLFAQINTSNGISSGVVG